LKRIATISLSPIYNHFHETLVGLTTIRAFRQVATFINKNDEYLFNYMRATYASNAASQWLNFRLQMISVVMIAIVGFIAIFQHIYSEANASLIGLALSYILSITGLLNGLITSFTETEKEMISVERLEQFDHIEKEQYKGTIRITSTQHWPTTATIQFFNVFLAYRRSDDNNALDNLSFKINSGLLLLLLFVNSSSFCCFYCHGRDGWGGWDLQSRIVLSILL
jgi:ATP-binding cassette, subfamily C (CFTR/MRP), member 10